MKKSRPQLGQCFGQWTLINFLASGGNGEVWEANSNTKVKAAIKILRTVNPKSCARFRDEIEVVNKNTDIKGLLSIIDFHLQLDLSESTPWYVMPLATPLSKHLEGQSATTIVQSFISLAATLMELHNRKISHRDIKPGNLFQLNDIPCFGDFGLVEYPQKNDLTQKGESVGPKWTMAPEMRRNAKKADGIPADVYSLAKTLCIFLTKQAKGFDGQYSSDSIYSLLNFQPNIYTTPLDKLFFDCTDNNPLKRPNIEEFQNRLKDWVKANENFQVRNKLQWKDIQKEIFPSEIPSRAIWEKIESIVDIMKKLSFTNDICHVFIPTGGGNDLEGVSPSHEPGCLELDFGNVIICKPKRLVFESFNYDEEWNYFRLECDKLEPTLYYPESINSESLTELKPLLYTDVNCSEFNDFDGMELPDGARAIDRMLCESSFVIFRKTSTYNKITSTYDARHNRMTTDQFRYYIGEAAKRLSVRKIKEKEAKTINFIRPSKYRTKNKTLSELEIQLINNIISLAEFRDTESIEIAKKYNIGNCLIMGDDNSFNYVREPRPQKKELEKALENLPKEQLVLMAAVMYGSRGASPPWGTPLDKLINYHKNDKDLVESITEKVSLVEYLRKGIELYSLE